MVYTFQGSQPSNPAFRINSRKSSQPEVRSSDEKVEAQQKRKEEHSSYHLPRARHRSHSDAAKKPLDSSTQKTAQRHSHQISPVRIASKTDKGLYDSLPPSNSAKEEDIGKLNHRRTIKRTSRLNSECESESPTSSRNPLYSKYKEINTHKKETIHVMTKLIAQQGMENSHRQNFSNSTRDFESSPVKSVARKVVLTTRQTEKQSPIRGTPVITSTKVTISRGVVKLAPPTVLTLPPGEKR